MSEDDDEEEDDTETEPSQAHSQPTKHYLDPSNATEDKYNEAFKDS